MIPVEVGEPLTRRLLFLQHQSEEYMRVELKITEEVPKDLSKEKSTTLGLECKSIEVEFQVGSVPRSWDCFAIQLL